MTLRSAEFDDIYFSVEDGMAETDYVFIAGCDLPAAWNDKPHYTIFETGFGTGLNCLRAAKIFYDTTSADQTLDIISVEKSPLTPAQIKTALSPWADALSPYLDDLLKFYPLRVKGLHPIPLGPRITLHLCIGDIQDILPQIFPTPDGQPPSPLIDSWFLDGFAPAKNPDMWCAALFEAIKDHSHSQTTLATFTAAGIVKRGLQSSGMTVSKIKGYGRKRDMLIARGHEQMRPYIPSKAPKEDRHIAIIGGGLAGCALAHRLTQRGIPHTVFESAQTIAAGASGNPLGLINPKLTAKPTPESDYYTTAYSLALTHARHLMRSHKDIAFRQSGSLHINISEDKERRFNGYLTNLGWHGDHMRRVSGDEASEIAGIPLPYGALYYPDAAYISPQRLCHAYAKDSHIISGCTIRHIEKDGTQWRLTDQNNKDYMASHIVYAGGGDAAGHHWVDTLPLHTVRGQISLVQGCEGITHLKTPLCFGGYLSPYDEALGGHILGASFKAWDKDTDLKDEDDDMNWQRLQDIMPNLISRDHIKSQRASFRLSSKDRFPLIGTQMDKKNMILNLGHGSHGIISGIYAAYLITAEIEGAVIPAYINVKNKINPARFCK